MKKLYVYMKPFFGEFCFSVICKGLGSFGDLIIPYIMGIIINTAIAQSDVSGVVRMCIVMLAVAIFVIVANIVGNYCGAKSTQLMGNKIRDALYAHIQKLPIREVESVTTSSLITRVTNDVEYVQSTILMLTRFAVRAPVTAIGGTILSLLIDPWLTLVMFIAMVLLMLASIGVYKITRPIYQKVQHHVDRLTSVLRENLEGVRIIKAFNKTDYEQSRFDGESRNIRENELKAGKVNALMAPAMTLISSITTAAILLLSGWRITSGDILIGDVFTILNYINMTLMSMMMIPRIFMMFSRSNTSADRIAEVLDIDAHTDYGVANVTSNENTILEFKNVSFTYPGANAPALENISFKIKRGETMAVIGGTGSGKTTLLNLTLRLYEPTSGEIYFCGKDIREYNKDTLKENITAAMQQYNIFGMTIKDNIILDRDYDADNLKEAAQAAQIYDLIEELEGEFDYSIAQNGANLSGGQKQRISVARTLYRKAGLVVLDDVSSALDYKTDLKLRRALKENFTDTSVILISQRISSVRAADKILVLKKGRAEGLDTHDKLVEGCEAYRDICRTQSVSEVGA